MSALDLTGTELPILPSPDAAPFWEALGRDEVVLPWCEACDRAFWYPRSICPTCGSREIRWRPATGAGVVPAVCINHVSPLPHLKALRPTVTALVELDEGVRMMGFLDADPDPGTVRCGLPVHIEVRADGAGRRVPVFVPTQPKESRR